MCRSATSGAKERQCVVDQRLRARFGVVKAQMSGSDASSVANDGVPELSAEILPKQNKPPRPVTRQPYRRR